MKIKDHKLLLMIKLKRPNIDVRIMIKATRPDNNFSLDNRGFS